MRVRSRCEHEAHAAGARRARWCIWSAHALSFAPPHSAPQNPGSKCMKSRQCHRILPVPGGGNDLESGTLKRPASGSGGRGDAGAGARLIREGALFFA